jgi:ribosome maturation factor RimP
LKAELFLDKVSDIVEPAAEDFGLELVDVVFAAERGRKVLRIFVDKPGGVTIDDLSALSREISTLLDVRDAVPGSYSLEVSSPGLDRPLKKEKDFIRFTGKRAQIRTIEPIDGRKNFRAAIIGAEHGVVTIEDADSKRFSIALGNIDKANLIIEI